MGPVPEVDFVVKNTFFELIRTNVPQRARAGTDTDLLGIAVRRATGDAGASPALVPSSPAVAPSPALEAFPMTPLLESTLECALPAGVAELADLSATADLKRVMGLEGDGSSTASQTTDEAATPPGTADSSAYTQPARTVFFATGPEDQRQQQQQAVSFPVAWACMPCDGLGGYQAWGAGGGAWPQPTAAVAVAPAQRAGDVVMEEHRTTLMIRDMPIEVSREMLTQVLDQLGLRGLYDMLYVPVDFSSGSGLGYAFVNVASPCDVPVIWAALDGFSSWGLDGTEKACSVRWSEPNQGLAVHVERYRNSPVMHPEVPDEWKPALFAGGVRVAFPPPTKKLKSPKVRSKKAAAAK